MKKSSLNKFSLEHCDQKKNLGCDFIVLTGGPGAGKTAILNFIADLLCPQIAVLPESANIVFKGGFWRLTSKSAKMASQRAIIAIQREMELLVKEEGKWVIGLCDRGLLDALAYWDHWGGCKEAFWKSAGCSSEQGYSRYKTVIHLRTPSAEQGYDRTNPIRIETAEEAAVLDKKIGEVWRDHPNYYEVPSSMEFSKKISDTIRIIRENIPEPYQSYFDKDIKSP